QAWGQIGAHADGFERLALRQVLGDRRPEQQRQTVDGLRVALLVEGEVEARRLHLAFRGAQVEFRSDAHLEGAAGEPIRLPHELQRLAREFELPRCRSLLEVRDRHLRHQRDVHTALRLPAREIALERRLRKRADPPEEIQLPGGDVEVGRVLLLRGEAVLGIAAGSSWKVAWPEALTA